MGFLPIGSILVTSLLGFVAQTYTSPTREILKTDTSLLQDLSIRYDEVEFPKIHLGDVYVDTDHELYSNLAKSLLPWTRSPSFHKNGTLWPVIASSFSPFSSADWLTFNTTTYELYGLAPFSASSFEVSVTLAPAFVNKTRYVAIPPQTNDSTPITFASASFTVHVISRGAPGPDLSGWIPYTLLILSGIAFFVLVVIATTCISQDLCCSCRSSLDNSQTEKREERSNPKAFSEDDCALSPCRKRRLFEYSWISSTDSHSHCEIRQVTPYEVTVTPGTIYRRATLLVKHRPFSQDLDERATQTAFLGTDGVQYVNALVGMLFAIRINPKDGSPNVACEDPQPGYRLHVVPHPPSWMYFCSNPLMLWGTPVEQLAPTKLLTFKISLVLEGTDHVASRINLTVSAPRVSEETGVSFSDVFTGTEKGVWYEHINGIDTLSILSETTYSIRYHPAAIVDRSAPVDRYYFKHTQPLPSWLAANSNPLEIRGDTTGCKRRDLRDLWVVDRFTERVVAKLRVTLVIAQE